MKFAAERANQLYKQTNSFAHIFNYAHFFGGKNLPQLTEQQLGFVGGGDEEDWKANGSLCYTRGSVDALKWKTRPTLHTIKVCSSSKLTALEFFLRYMVRRLDTAPEQGDGREEAQLRAAGRLVPQAAEPRDPGGVVAVPVIAVALECPKKTSIFSLLIAFSHSSIPLCHVFLIFF